MSKKNTKPIIIKASTEDLKDEKLWPTDSLPAREEFTKEVIQDQVRSAYGQKASGEKFEKITEDLWNRFEFDTPYARYYNLERLGVPGKFTILREWIWPERFDVLERCHLSWERNPLSRAGVEWTNHFVIGSGGQLSYRAKEIKPILDDFREDPVNDVEGMEREACTALQIDGEIIVRYYKNNQGRTVIVPLRPWHIHWIDTAPGNYKEATAYHYVYTIYRSMPGQSDFGIEDVPVNQILHLSLNKLPYELRGRPDIFSILPWLKAYRDWLEERARLNRRKTIYYQLKVKNASPNQVAKYQADFATPPPPGSILVTNDNVELIVVGSNIHAEEVVEDGRQIKLMAESGMLMPEFYFADAAQSTLASATAQALPVLKKFDNYQHILAKRFWTPIYKQVIRNAIEANHIKEMVAEVDEDGKATGNTIRAIDAFSYDYPEIKEKDPHNLAQALQIAVAGFGVSQKTAQIKMGFDPEKERERINLQGKPSPLTQPAKPTKKPAGKQPVGKGKRPGSKRLVTPIYPDQPMGLAQDRTLMPSQSAPAYSGNNPPSGGAGSD